MAALLFQLPPNFKKDVGLLKEFLALLPPKTTAAFEFRNASWLEDDVFEALRARNIALCFADSETRETPLVHTADYAYFRLRDEGYGDADIAKWTDAAKRPVPRRKMCSCTSSTKTKARARRSASR